MKKFMRLFSVLTGLVLALSAMPFEASAASSSSTLKVINVTPDKGEKGVDLDTNIEVKFSNSLDKKSITESSYSDITVNGKACYKAKVSGSKLIITPLKSSLSSNKKYTVKINSGVVKDTKGNKNKEYEFSFTTANKKQTFKVARTTPGEDVKNVKLDSKIEVQFSDTLNKKSISGSGSSRIKINGKQCYKVVISGKKLTITPLKTDLAPNTEYTVKIDSGAVKDTEGNKNDSYEFKFTTASK